MKKTLLTVALSFLLVGCGDNLKEADKAYNAGNYAEAYQLYKKPADNGNVDAQYKIGRICSKYDNSFCDFDQSKNYLDLALAKGDSLSQLYLCYLYSDSDEQPYDDDTCKKAFNETKKLADNGNVEAQKMIGFLYSNYFSYAGGSSDYEQDKKNAIKYYKLAADNGDQEALFKLWDMAVHNKDYEKSWEYLDLIKKQKYPLAQLLVANDFQQEVDNPDPNKKDNWEYQLSLTDMRDDASMLYKLAADEGNGEAQYKLGLIEYEYNSNKDRSDEYEKDYKTAVKYLTLSSEQNNINAQYLLGVMYFNGEGVRQDKEKAKSYFGDACDNGMQKGCDAYKELNR